MELEQTLQWAKGHHKPHSKKVRERYSAVEDPFRMCYSNWIQFTREYGHELDGYVDIFADLNDFEDAWARVLDEAISREPSSSSQKPRIPPWSRPGSRDINFFLKTDDDCSDTSVATVWSEDETVDGRLERLRRSLHQRRTSREAITSSAQDTSEQSQAKPVVRKRRPSHLRLSHHQHSHDQSMYQKM